MDQSKINVRYAKAFFSLAMEKELTDVLQQDAQTVASVCATSSDFNRLLDSPVIPPSGKVKAIKSIFEGKVHDYTLKFLVLIVNNRREKFIPSIFRDLISLYRKSQGISTAMVSTATPLDQPVVDQIRMELEKLSGGKVELSQTIDPELIGGFVIRVDDRQYDASVATQLKKIKEKLLHTELKLNKD